MTHHSTTMLTHTILPPLIIQAWIFQQQLPNHNHFSHLYSPFWVMFINVCCEFQNPNQQYSSLLATFILVITNLFSACFFHFVKKKKKRNMWHTVPATRANIQQCQSGTGDTTVQYNCLLCCSNTSLPYKQCAGFSSLTLNLFSVMFTFSCDTFFVFTRLRSANFSLLKNWLSSSCYLHVS